MISGANGDLIWEFWDNETNPNDEGWYNFYTSQIIEDQTGDGFPDILAAKKVAEYLKTDHTSIILTEEEMLQEII